MVQTQTKSVERVKVQAKDLKPNEDLNELWTKYTYVEKLKASNVLDG
ncbi:hypothetical protein [Cohnella abietis]|nr:hypothetical protein [Cohnella abietis]